MENGLVSRVSIFFTGYHMAATRIDYIRNEKMKPVFIVADNIVSPLGQTTTANFDLLKAGHSGIQLHQNAFSPSPYYASLFDEKEAFTEGIQNSEKYTRFERLLIHSIQNTQPATPVFFGDNRTILIIATTKGNIGLLEKESLSEELVKRISLFSSAQRIGGHFGFVHSPRVISHACISGMVALITGMRLLQAGLYDHAVVAGADLITRFVLSGFQSFHAVSDLPCKPFDKERNGITLGEAAATIILSVKEPSGQNCIRIAGGAVSNDANHISGPSRTGAELHQAIETAIREASVSKAAIDFISAHGTATLYNDEMESKAINLSGLEKTPLNSLKGYYGHTLGAAGLLESVISGHSLLSNTILPTPGFEQPGTSLPVHVNTALKTGSYHYCLKTGSGFGGCNAAVILKKT